MIRSNRESGFGRYDIMLIPRPQREGSLPAMVLEFKFYYEKIHSLQILSIHCLVLCRNRPGKYVFQME